MPAKKKKKLAKLKAKVRSAKAAVGRARTTVKARTKARRRAPKKPSPVPKGFHTLTPSLTVKDCAEAIAFYKRALGAVEVSRLGMPGSDLVWHCHLKIGDSNLFLNDPMPGGGPAATAHNPSSASMFLYVDDCDAAMQRAVDAGMTITMPMMDAFWGDRMGNVSDRFGNSWSFASCKKIMTEAEMEKAGRAFAAEQAAQQSAPPAGATALPGTPALA